VHAPGTVITVCLQPLYCLAELDSPHTLLPSPICPLTNAQSLNCDERHDQTHPAAAPALCFLAQGYDVLAKAKTGTGKTLAFLIPIAEHLAASPPPVRHMWATCTGMQMHRLFLPQANWPLVCMLFCFALNSTIAICVINVCLRQYSGRHYVHTCAEGRRRLASG
jgi:hypothetical protein